MSTSTTPFRIVIQPRMTMNREEFISATQPYSIGLDGAVLGGPFFDSATMHFNYDHHDCVIRDATMSTAMQVYFAIKGGLMKVFPDGVQGSIYINDTDQDTAFAAWLLLNYKKFEGTQSIPHINRLLSLNDRWDITGGAFPMNLSDKIVQQHNWVFRPYTDLRKSGGLAQAGEAVMRDNLEAVMARLNIFLMGEAEGVVLDTRHTILHDSTQYKIVHEIGGNEARYHLYSHGMDAFISLVAQRPDGRSVWSIGRRSQYIPFPVQQLYDDFNAAEGFTRENGWNGSTIVGGSSRMNGSGLTWQQLRDITDARLRKEGILS